MFVSGVESSTSYSLRMLADSMQSLQRSVARLSSGSKLAWIGEDPAGAGISIKVMRSQPSTGGVEQCRKRHFLFSNPGWLPQASRRSPGSHERVVGAGAGYHQDRERSHSLQYRVW